MLGSQLTENVATNDELQLRLDRTGGYTHGYTERCRMRVGERANLARGKRAGVKGDQDKES